MDDRRIFERKKVAISIKFRSPETAKEGSGETEDISASGIGFITGERLPINTEIEIYINLLHHKSTLSAHAKVVWTEPRNNGRQQRIGVCIEKGDLINIAQQVLYDLG